MDTPKLHVLAALSFKGTPITAETLVDSAEAIGFKDTPQSLRSRLVELERAGYTRRTDRNGISRHGRPCWRWTLTQKAREHMQQDNLTTNER